jgi:RHH-type rel operon transcriptional repressor/antitoxin RelB
MKRSADNRLKVVAVRVSPQIEHRLRLLAQTTGRRQSFFLQQIIEQGIDAMEETWLPEATLAKIRRGDFPELPHTGSTPDLFGD